MEPGAGYYFYYHMWLATLTAFIICIGCFSAIPMLSFEARTNLHSLVVSVMQWSSAPANQHGADDVDEDIDAIEYQPIPQPDAGDDAVSVDAMSEILADETTLSRWLEGTLLMVSAAAVALWAQNLSDMISLCGATYCTYMTYIFPAVVYLVAMKEYTADVSYIGNTEDTVFKCVAWISIPFGILVFFAGVVTICISP